MVSSRREIPEVKDHTRDEGSSGEGSNQHLQQLVRLFLLAEG